MSDMIASHAAFADVARQSAEQVRLDAWRTVLEKTDRIISERPVTVTIEDAIPYGMDDVAAWSDGEKIFFNGNKVRDMMKSQDSLGAVLRLKGLNYHELCHVLYTPRMSEDLPKRVVAKVKDTGDSTWWYAMNALEDQRIESWFTASYGPSRRYFEAMILQWIVNDGNAESAILTYGRKYLPAKIRVQAGRVFVKKYGQPLYDEFKAVIDQYLTVMLPTESVRAFTLVAKFHDLLVKMSQQSGAQPPPMPLEDNGMHDHHNGPGQDTPGVARVGQVSRSGAAEAKERSAEQAAKAAQADKDAEKALDEPAQDGDADGSDKAEDGSDGQPGQSKGQAQDGGSETGQPGQGSQTTGAGTSEVQGQGAGSESGQHEVVKDERTLSESIGDLLDAAGDGLDEIAEDPTVKADAERTMESIKSIVANGRLDASGGLARTDTTVSASGDHLTAVRRIEQILRRIKTDAEPAILHRQMSGRVDVRRVLSRNPNEFDVFKSYDEGTEDEAGVEAVVLLDISGSMSHRMREASEAVWVLKRAFDKAGVRTTVLGYDTQHIVIFQPSEKAKARIPVINSRGGTDPESALQQALAIFGKSHMANRVLITVTDGQWGGSAERHHVQMATMKRLGVTSMLIGLDNAVQHYGKHEHDTSHDLESVKQLPKAALKLVTQILRDATNRA